MLRRVLLLVLLPAVLGLAACGGDDDDNGKAAAPATPQPTAKAEDFPSASGRTLNDLVAQLPEGPILAPSVSILDVGRGNRVAFALFDAARKQLSGAQVALYYGRADGTGARGPYVARSESLEVKPQYRSRQTAQDPDAARSVYVADVPFQRRGKGVLIALVRLDGRLLASTAYSITVGARGAEPPKVGEKAIRVHTETAADVGGNLERIDTRVPPLRDLHEADLADVLGRRPVVLLFATPQLCQSRVCGPVVDVAAQVQAEAGKGVDFIHQEIYKENTINKGFRSQVADYRLPTEPWLFVIDRRGVVAERIEGAFSVGELSRAVAKVR